jgi:ComF family protein
MCIFDMVVGGAHRTLRALTATLFPEHCLLTGILLQSQASYAPGIDDAALLFHQPAPRSVEIELLIQRHVHADDLMISSFISLWGISATSTIDNAVYAVKYSGRTRLAVALGGVLAEHPAMNSIDRSTIVCPLPIHRARKRERGYNQAERIAVGLCDRTGLAMLTEGVIVRTRYRESQTTLSDVERRANVAGIFSVAKPEMVRDQRILLIDDVLTTGSTLNSCATALIEAGARRVDVATLCVAV